MSNLGVTTTAGIYPTNVTYPTACVNSSGGLYSFPIQTNNTYYPPITTLYAEEKITDNDLKDDLFNQLKDTDIERMPPETLKRLREKIMSQVENFVRLEVVRDPFNPDIKKIVARLNIS